MILYRTETGHPRLGLPERVTNRSLAVILMGGGVTCDETFFSGAAAREGGSELAPLCIFCRSWLGVRRTGLTLPPPTYLNDGAYHQASGL